jgi:tricorn protease
MTRFALVLLTSIPIAFAQSDPPLLLQKPTINRTHIVFSYAGDLWSVSREGGDAIRLTAGPGVETDPHFSPDGKQIAFTGEYDGNVDVYLMPASGGVPRRLTYHPAQDTVAGWTPDGKQILFRSTRNSYARFSRLFTIPVDGAGLPAELPLPMAEEGSYSPDGTHLAYLPLARAFLTWKRYRGGRTTPIWIANLADSGIEKLPRQNSNDFAPMWVGDKVYFLSDRNGPVTLFAYDTTTKKVSELIQNSGFDLKDASAGPGAIAYEQFGEIHLFDLKTATSHKVEIRVTGDLPEVRPRLEKVATQIVSASLSPTGARALFEARGEILTVPAEKGSIRNLTNTPGAAERNPAWSPDGKQIAYFSDESGEYQLHIRNQNGMGDLQKIKLGGLPSFYYGPVWSPDGKKIAYTTRLTLWYIDREKQSPVKVDTDAYDSPFHDINPGWSPDSKWIAYTRLLKNHLRAVYLYSVDDARTYQVSDGMSDAEYAVFDKNGKYLYFTASTNLGLSTAWLDMSSLDRQVTRSAYVVVLSRDEASPLAPESDDEKGEDKARDAEKKADSDGKSDARDKPKEPVKVKIDLANIGQRILALPIAARDYRGMLAGKEGILFLIENPPGPSSDGPLRLSSTSLS